MKKKLFGLLTLVGLLAGCQNIPSSSAEPSTPPSSVAPSSTLPSSETPTTSQTPPSSNSSSENPSTPPISSSTPEPEPEPTVNDILVQLQSDELAVQGTLTQYVNQEGYEPQSASSTISCYISDSRYYNVEMEDGEVTYLTDYVADEDGLVSTRSLDPETNTVIDTPVYSGGETVLFSEMFYNPFVSIAAEDVTVEDGIVTFDISDQLAFEIAYVTTFYSDIPMDTLTATVDEDYNVTSVTIGYENHVENDPQYGTYTEGAKYVFELVTAEEIGVPKNIEPRPENPKTEPLAELFEDLAAGNYTVHTETLWGESIDELYEDQNADLKVTEEGVLHQDNYYGTTSGYLKVEEGIAEVVLEDGKLVGQGVPSASSLAEVVGLSPFSYMANMFDVSEDGKTFTLASGYGLVDNAYLLIPDPITYPNAYPDEGKFTITFNDELYGNFSLRAVVGSFRRVFDVFRTPTSECVDVSTLEARHGFGDDHGFFFFDFTFGAGVGTAETGNVHSEVRGYVEVENVDRLFDFSVVFHDVQQVGEYDGLGFHRCRRTFVFLNRNLGHFGFDDDGRLFDYLNDPFFLAPAEHADAGSQGHDDTDFQKIAAFVFQIGLGRFFEFHMVSSGLCVNRGNRITDTKLCLLFGKCNTVFCGCLVNEKKTYIWRFFVLPAVSSYRRKSYLYLRNGAGVVRRNGSIAASSVG